MEGRILAGEEDFLETSKSRHFIDKTLLIRDFLVDDPEVKVITAPSRFGKSTVIDMVKRFAGIVVDSKGKQIAPHTTQNYKLFCDPPLKICRNNRTFVDKHLGQHPVVHLHYSPLRYTDEFTSLLDGLLKVLLATFEEHKYLAENSTLFTTDASKNLFMKYYDEFSALALTGHDILHGFQWLPKLLHEHFGRQVIILLDEYDAYCNSLLSDHSDDTDRIIEFLANVTGNLFQYNPYLKKALLTGVLRVEGVGVSPVGNNVGHYRFLGDHEFSRYYGFTDEEVLELLQRNVHDETNRKEAQRVLKMYYDGYMIQNQNTKIYNTWSVVEFFVSNMKPHNYWFENQHVSRTTSINYIDKILKEIKKLLFGGSILVDISRPLSLEMIVKLEEMNRFLKVDNAVEEEWFFLFVFQLGFLKPVSKNQDTGRTTLKIPNFEIQTEFARILAQDYQGRYDYRRQDVVKYITALAGFVPGENSTQGCKTFYRSVYNFFHDSTHYPSSENDLQSVLLIYAAQKFPLGTRTSSEYPTVIFDKQNKSRRGTTDIIIINDHKMAIVIGIKFQQSGTQQGKMKKKIISVDKLAKEAHKQILHTYHPNIIHNNCSLLNVKNISSAVYIGIGFDEGTRNVSIVCSDNIAIYPLLINAHSK